MSKPVKILTLLLWIVAVSTMVGMVAIQLSTRDNQKWVPDFSLTDQLGRTVSDKSLHGSPWIADFIFTQCATACPMMSSRLASLQSRIPANVKFVSFTVDPEHDNPARLLKYAREYGADNDRWYFLTGDKNYELATVRGMRVSAIPAQDGQIMHDTHYMLITADGKLKGVYANNDPTEMEQLVKDANDLAGSKP